MLLRALGSVATGAGAMDDDFEIDLTADAPGDLLPIRWIGPGGAPSPTNGNGNGHHNGNGHSDSNGGHSRADLDTVIDVASYPAPLVVTLGPYVPQVAETREPEPRLARFEVDEWDDVPVVITLRRAMASRGARFLAVVIVTIFALLLGATVLLWERVEESHQPGANEPATNTLQQKQLVAVQSRLNSVETRLSSMLDETQTVVTSPAPSVLEFELALLRNCLVEFQRAIDVGRVRGGQFNYC